MRIGKRFKMKCTNIKTIDGNIPWLNEIKYLGIKIKSGFKFKASFNDTKSKFYIAFNSLYSKLGKILDPKVSLHLLNTIATPILLYASEALFLNKSEINSLNHSYCRALCKIFNVFKSDSLQYCMYMFGIKNLCEVYNIRKENYVIKLKISDIGLLTSLLNNYVMIV